MKYRKGCNERDTNEGAGNEVWDVGNLRIHFSEAPIHEREAPADEAGPASLTCFRIKKLLHRILLAISTNRNHETWETVAKKENGAKMRLRNRRECQK
jgi:hypothetical protein